MSKTDYSQKAIQADRQAAQLRTDAYKADGTYSPPGTRAAAHVAQTAQRLENQASFIQKVADWFGKKSMEE